MMRSMDAESGAELWHKLAMAVRVKGMFTSSCDDALLVGEMVSDYLEQAAGEEAEREQIRRNEFAWVLQNALSSLEEQGTLPPRFEGIIAAKVAVGMPPPLK